MKKLYVVCAAAMAESAFVAAARERFAEKGIRFEELAAEEYGREVAMRSPEVFSIREFTSYAPSARNGRR